MQKPELPHLAGRTSLPSLAEDLRASRWFDRQGQCGCGITSLRGWVAEDTCGVHSLGGTAHCVAIPQRFDSRWSSGSIDQFPFVYSYNLQSN